MQRFAPKGVCHIFKIFLIPNEKSRYSIFLYRVPRHFSLSIKFQSSRMAEFMNEIFWDSTNLEILIVS